MEQVDTLEKLDEREKYWIEFYKSNQEEFGYNLTSGGAGTHSHIISNEVREKIRQAKLGNTIWLDRHHTEESKKKISEARKGKDNHQLGRKRSEESKQKMRLAKLGKKLSEEHKKNIGIASGLRKHTEETKKKIGLSQKGRIVTEEERLKRIGNKSRTGKPHSPETIQKMKDVWLRRKQQLELCVTKE